MNDSSIKLFYMLNIFQHVKNIKKIYSLNLKLFFIIKYIIGIFQKKLSN